MTTIVLDREARYVAADRKATYGLKAPFGISDKLHWITLKSNHKILVAGAGATDSILLLHHYLSKCNKITDLIDFPKEERERIKDLDALVIDPHTGDVYSILAGLIPDLLKDPYWAVGAGWEMALALMDAGVDVPLIFEIIGGRTGHTSKEYDIIYY